MNPDQKLYQDIGSAKNPQALLVALREYYQAADEVGEKVRASIPVKTACREGCAFCCYIPVAARAQEVFLLADFIRSHFSVGRQSALLHKLRSHSAKVLSMSYDAQAVTNIPCPMLEDSKCSVYTARPLACRAYHSVDVSSCQRSFENPNDLEETRPQLADLSSAWMTMTGLANGVFAQQGYDQTGYELGSALLAALTNTATLKRFYRRKNAFPDAKKIWIPAAAPGEQGHWSE